MTRETSDSPTRRIMMIGMGRGGVDARIFKGFNQYRRGARDWILNDMGHFNDKLPMHLHRRDPFGDVDGVVGHLLDAELVAVLLEEGVAAVDVSGSPAARGLPQVVVDGVEIGKMAASHFDGRHYASYLYVSNGVRHFERARWKGFQAGVLEKNQRALWCVLDSNLVTPDAFATFPEIVTGSLTGLLGKAPRPLAVLAATDFTGGQICGLARSLGLRVPDELSVLGVDDFELLCESSDPPLSSISYPAERIGFESARVLDSLMRGQSPDVPPPLPPTHVHTRESTELTAVEDPVVARAVHYMRNHVAEPLRLADIASHVHTHERTLLRHFQKAIGRTPTEELLRIRLERARELLMGSDAPVYEVSGDCGFSSPDMLGRHFKAETGLSPSEFRGLHRM